MASPARKSIFKVKNDSPELDKLRSDIFHSVVAKLLFIMKQGRPDLETPVLLLMKRVSKSNEEDWNTLKRCLGFRKRTIKYKRMIGAYSLKNIYVWIDALHAVHENKRGHTGGGKCQWEQGYCMASCHHRN